MPLPFIVTPMFVPFAWAPGNGSQAPAAVHFPPSALTNRAVIAQAERWWHWQLLCQRQLRRHHPRLLLGMLPPGLLQMPWVTSWGYVKCGMTCGRLELCILTQSDEMRRG